MERGSDGVPRVLLRCTMIFLFGILTVATLDSQKKVPCQNGNRGGQENLKKTTLSVGEYVVLGIHRGNHQKKYLVNSHRITTQAN